MICDILFGISNLELVVLNMTPSVFFCGVPFVYIMENMFSMTDNIFYVITFGNFICVIYIVSHFKVVTMIQCIWYIIYVDDENKVILFIYSLLKWNFGMSVC